jgi:hypothetical protein
VDYEVGSFNHTLQIRHTIDTTPEDVVLAFNDFISACGILFHSSTFVSARFAAGGSNISAPLAGTWPVGWGDTPASRVDSANYVDFIGRSVDGRRVRLAIFGAKNQNLGDDYRMNSAESAPMLAGVNELNSHPGIFVSINAFQPLWYPYANLGTNAYWRNHIR